MFTKKELEEIAKADAEIDAMDNAVTPEILKISRELDKVAHQQAGSAGRYKSLTPEERAEHRKLLHREYMRDYNHRPYVKERIKAYNSRPEVREKRIAYLREWRARKKRQEEFQPHLVAITAKEPKL